MKIAAIAFALAAGAAAASGTHDHGDHPRTPAPEGAMAWIVAPQDGATVSNPVTVVFGAKGIGIAPAGVEWPNTGHHHLLINTTVEGDDLAMSLPATDQIRHFGGGQTQVTLELPPGTHTLQLLMGDHDHIPHDPPILSETITITVR